ncbi:MAG: hypothetical protein K2N72_02365 [Oscillospiraceae bacterium]|nr:hypothetical protein [Oscillospiraceae bacterium]
MKKRIGILFAVVMAVTMLCGISVYAVEARYIYATSATSTLTKQNSSVTCTSTAQGNSTVTKIAATQYLEKKDGDNWEVVKGCKWSSSTESAYLYASNSKSSLGSGTYRLRTVFTVYSGTSSETIEKTSSEVTI